MADGKIRLIDAQFAKNNWKASVNLLPVKRSMGKNQLYMEKWRLITGECKISPEPNLWYTDEKWSGSWWSQTLHMTIGEKAYDHKSLWTEVIKYGCLRGSNFYPLQLTGDKCLWKERNTVMRKFKIHKGGVKTEWRSSDLIGTVCDVWWSRYEYLPAL